MVALESSVAHARVGGFYMGWWAPPTKIGQKSPRPGAYASSCQSKRSTVKPNNHGGEESCADELSHAPCWQSPPVRVRCARVRGANTRKPFLRPSLHRPIPS